MKKAIKAAAGHGLASYFGREVDFSPDVHTMILASYYANKLDLAAVSRDLHIPFKQLVQWRKTDANLARDLDIVEEILHEEINGQFMARVMDPADNYAGWKIFYLKSRDPRYQDKAKKREVVLSIRDSAFEPAPQKVLAQEAATEVIDAVTD